MRKNSLLNRPTTIQQKIETFGGTVKAKVKNNKVFLDIIDISKAIMVPIVFSYFPHAEIEKEMEEKFTVRIV